MSNIRTFRVPATILTGVGTLNEVGRQAEVLGITRALLVTDQGILATGLIDSVLALLEDRGISAKIFSDVAAEPPFGVVDEGASLALSKKCDGVIGLGGGSSIDCAKGIALVSKHGGDIRDVVGVDLVKERGLPTIMLPATAGTGSEVTGIAIYTDEENSLKVGVVSPHLIPNVAIIDPQATVTAPPGLTAYTGIDALTHAIEAFVSINATPITDALATDAIRRIAGSLREAVADGSRMAAREEVAMGSLLAGMAFANAGVAAVHALAYPLGARYHLAHGLCNSLLLPAVMRASWTGNTSKYAEVAKLMGEYTEGLSVREAAHKGIEAVTYLSCDVGIPSRMRELGVAEESLRPMAEEASQIDRLLRNNPKKLTIDDIYGIYQHAY